MSEAVSNQTKYNQTERAIKCIPILGLKLGDVTPNLDVKINHPIISLLLDAPFLGVSAWRAL